MDRSVRKAPIVGHRTLFGRFAIADSQLSTELGCHSLGMTLAGVLPLARQRRNVFFSNGGRRQFLILTRNVRSTSHSASVSFKMTAGVILH